MSGILTIIGGSDIDTYYAVESFLQAGDACIATEEKDEIGGCVRFGFDITKARSVRLDGKTREELAVKDNAVSIGVGRGKIFTLEVE